MIKFERFCRTFLDSFNGFYQNFSILSNSYLSVFSVFLLKEDPFSFLLSYLFGVNLQRNALTSRFIPLKGSYHGVNKISLYFLDF